MNLFTLLNRINPRERLNVKKLLQHPFITADSPFQYEINLNGNKEEYRKEIFSSNSNSNTDIRTFSSYNLSNKLISETVKLKEVKLESKEVNERKESLKKNESEDLDQEAQKKISIRIPGKRRRRNTKDNSNNSNNANANV